MSVLAPGADAVRRTPADEVIVQAGEQRSARIESLRALAALAVVACHAWGFSTPARLDTFHSRLVLGLGFLGVVVFFTLSGYLIYRPFARRDFGDGQPVRLTRAHLAHPECTIAKINWESLLMSYFSFQLSAIGYQHSALSFS